MGRVTRAMAAEAAVKHNGETDFVLEVPEENVELVVVGSSQDPSPSSRAPLGDITANSASPCDSTEDIKKRAKGKKRGKKSTKEKQAKYDNYGQSDGTDSAHEAEQSQHSHDEAQTECSSTRQSASQAELCPNLGSSMSDIDIGITKATTSPNAVTCIQDIGAPTIRADISTTSGPRRNSSAARTPTVLAPKVKDQQNPEPMAEVSALDAPASPLPSATPKVVANLKKERAGWRSTSNKENLEPVESPASSRARTPQPATSYDALEAAVIEAATPPIAARSVSPAAIAVNDAPAVAESESKDDAPMVKDIKDEMPPSPTPNHGITQSSSPELEPMMPGEPKETPASQEPIAARAGTKIKVKKAAPIVRTTKASQARISMAHGEKVASDLRASTAKPRASSMFTESVGLNKGVGSKSQLGASQRAISSGSEVCDEEVKKDVYIPHSKARPVSMSFPAPPGPIKSSKPPTKSTFQLPGEAIAAKLKAAKEERLKKEAEEPEKRPAFKARPAPTAPKRAPVVRPTNSSKFRESIASGKDAKSVVAELSHKRANSVAVGNRLSLASKEAASLKLAPARISPRPSTSLANISKPRASLATDSRPVTSKGTSKGKEVFSRPALAKEQAEKEKREKEEAAKKARAEAAERGRQASREWAEKQKAKKMKDAEAKATVTAA